MTVRRLTALLVVAVLLAACTTTPGTAEATAAGWWKPSARATRSWQIQFTGTLDTTVPAQVFDVDGDATTRAQVAALHARGARVICYVSAGSYENWRADAARFPAGVLGDDLDGWPGERWLDIRQWGVLGPIMQARFQSCRAKGFDAVDPDNMDGYANRNGLGLTAGDQLTYNRRIAALAHRLGLGVGLKNDLDQIPALLPSFDFAVNEQCAYYRECAKLSPFVAAGKPVLQIEYEVLPATFCPQSRRLGLTPVFKKLALTAYRRIC